MMGFGFFGIGMFMMVAFWVLIIGGAVWVVLALMRGNHNPSAANLPQTYTPNGQALTAGPSQTPLDVLKLRYAKGEITKEQYDLMKRDLDA